MNGNTLYASFLGFVRHALTAAGGSLAAGGYIGNDELTAIVGGLVAAAGLAWSVVEKYLRK